jgi:hypothetical protein
MVMTDRNPQLDPWPHWLEEIYGPEPEGPRRRVEALRQDAERRREIERRLSENAKT